MFGNDEVPNGMSGWSMLHAMTAQIPIDPADADSNFLDCADLALLGAFNYFVM